jgi:AhpD family alkylhydroperoxidase
MAHERVSAARIAPEGYKTLTDVEAYLRRCGLEQSLIELVKMRASQINGCAFCLDMHSRDARRNGESEQRLYLLDAWQESSLYTPRERAALAWTDAVTRIADTHAPDAAYDALRPHFSEKEIADLTILVGMINLWNRIAIGFRYTVPVEADKAA